MTQILLLPVTMLWPTERCIYQVSPMQEYLWIDEHSLKPTGVRGLFSPLCNGGPEIETNHVKIDFYGTWYVRNDDVMRLTGVSFEPESEPIMAVSETPSIEQPTLIDLVDALPAWDYFQVDCEASR